MDIYLLIDGQQEGPYTEDQVRQSLADDRIRNDLPAWCEGLTDWVQVSALISKSERDAVEVQPEDSKPVQIQSPTTPAPSKSKPKNAFKYVCFGLTGFAGLILLGLSAGVGAGLVHKRNLKNSAGDIIVTERLYVPSKLDTNPPTRPVSPPVTMSMDESVTLKISYLYKATDETMGNVTMATNESSQGTIAIYGLPSTFADGDVWAGNLYPAGVWISGDKKFHAYALTKIEAHSKLSIQAQTIITLPIMISAYRKMVADMDKMIAVDRQTGMDSDAYANQQKRDEIQRKLDKDQQRLSALQ